MCVMSPMAEENHLSHQVLPAGLVGTAKIQNRQDVCEHPSSILPVHPVSNGFFGIPQLSPSFAFIPGDLVGFVLCQGPKRHRLEKHKGRFSAKEKILWFVSELQRHSRSM